VCRHPHRVRWHYVLRPHSSSTQGTQRAPAELSSDTSHRIHTSGEFAPVARSSRIRTGTRWHVLSRPCPESCVRGRLRQQSPVHSNALRMVGSYLGAALGPREHVLHGLECEPDWAHSHRGAIPKTVVGFAKPRTSPAVIHASVPASGVGVGICV